ncbi:MAG: tRNA (adenosine(37)-N6)-threonylcarbamoyltransferase complex dimerization subunit type 1 TsaB [Bacteroidia bacterium]
MALILNLETATKMCSVALISNGKVLAFKEQGGDYTHAENLTLFIEAVFAQAGMAMQSLDAVAVSKGPGSYTGLRIGVSVAKGLCYALDKPLLAIDTLESLAAGCTFSSAESYLLCPMLDARRMEVYCALYDQKGGEVEAASARIIDELAFRPWLEKGKVVFFGDGAAKCKPLLNHPNAVFLDNLEPSARFMAGLSEKAFQSGKREDIAYFVPAYLKDFQAGKKAGA